MWRILGVPVYPSELLLLLSPRSWSITGAVVVAAAAAGAVVGVIAARRCSPKQERGVEQAVTTTITVLAIFEALEITIEVPTRLKQATALKPKIVRDPSPFAES